MDHLKPVIHEKSGTATPEFVTAFPEKVEVYFKYGFDPETNLPKINIYRKSDQLFIGAFVIEAAEVPALVKWAKEIKTQLFFGLTS